jgi:4-diphosphocytidyl-2-C-methyl-D-erythritol kinase
MICQSVTRRACAKVNLTLEVLAKRTDGYHEVCSLLQEVDLFDTILLRPSEELVLEVDDLSICGDDNLVLRAASKLLRVTGQTGAIIKLRKAIPIAAGLGGGSSDAAATLLGLAELLGIDKSAPEIEEMAVQLGSDVPFFLRGGAALATGRGDVLTPLPSVKRFWVVVAVPRVRIPNKTAWMYGQLTPGDFSDGSRTRSLSKAVMAGQPVRPDMLFNVFERIARASYAEVDACFRNMEDLGADSPQLCGAGPAVYALCQNQDDGLLLKRSLTSMGCDSYLASCRSGGSVARHLPRSELFDT